MGKRNWFLLVVFLALVFILRLMMISRPHFLSGTKVKIVATLREEPQIIGQTQRFTLSNIKIRTWRYPEVHYGERLEVVGTIKKGSEIEMVEEIRVLEETSDFRGKILTLRREIQKVYWRLLPEPQSSLLSGIVLGSKSGLPGDFYEDLRKTGVLHVVVASGMNVTLVGSTLLSFFLWFFSRKVAVVLAFLGIWFYVLLAGAETPVIRAGIMATLTFLAAGIGREADAWRALIISALILLLINPLSLFDLGFQLTFSATVGILFFGGRISSRTSWLPKEVRPDIAQTIGAQLTVLPLLLFNFGQYSPLSLPANFLVVTILSLIMKLGAAVAILGLIFLPLGQVAAWLVWPFLTYFVKVVELFGR